ncbi:MAG: hypothetical protein V1679_02585, partial [Candidatus Peregrinibacteria bacterium]
MLEKFNEIAIDAALNAVSGGIAAVRSIGRQVAEAIEAQVIEALQMSPPRGKDMLTNLRDGANQTIKDVLRLAVASAKTLRIIDRINVHTLPKLLENEQEDEQLKNDIIDHLNSRISARAPLYEEIEMVANDCFDKGGQPENLVRFFESDEILLMLVDCVLNMEHSRYRASNALAAVSSTLQSAALKIDTAINRKKKKPVTPEIKEKLELFFDNFKYKYDPRDPQYTVQAFM